MRFLKTITRRRGEGSLPIHDESQQPLLGHDDDGDGGTGGEEAWCGTASQREDLQLALSSKSMHYLILGLVSLDVAALMTNIFLELYECDTDGESRAWVGPLHEGLETAGLVFSSVFLLELLLCMAAFGIEYFSDWFHCLDGVVIIASFVIDLLSHGIVEDIASLVIIFRLFRFVKLVEEMSVGASVEMEAMNQELEKLQRENRQLKTDLAQAHGEHV